MECRLCLILTTSICSLFVGGDDDKVSGSSEASEISAFETFGLAVTTKDGMLYALQPDRASPTETILTKCFGLPMYNILHEISHILFTSMLPYLLTSHDGH
jgi:hypothetical protein